VEVEPDVFYLGSSNFYTSGKGYLFRLDLRGWKPSFRGVSTQDDPGSHHDLGFFSRTGPLSY
jgi:hypothetical protein